MSRLLSRCLLSALAAGLAVALGGCNNTPAGLANKDKDKVGEMIVGAWEVTKAGSYTPEGSVLQFAKDGKLKVTMKIDDKETCTDWTYVVDGDKINLAGTLVDTEVKQTLQ